MDSCQKSGSYSYFKERWQLWLANYQFVFCQLSLGFNIRWAICEHILVHLPISTSQWDFLATTQVKYKCCSVCQFMIMKWLWGICHLTDIQIIFDWLRVPHCTLETIEHQQLFTCWLAARYVNMLELHYLPAFTSHLHWFTPPPLIFFCEFVCLMGTGAWWSWGVGRGRGAVLTWLVPASLLDELSLRKKEEYWSKMHQALVLKPHFLYP